MSFLPQKSALPGRSSKSIFIALGITACATVFIKVAYTKFKKSQTGFPSTADAANHESIALLQPLFDKATQQAQHLSLNQNDQLMLYGLYKQATVGNVNITKPSILNIVAWKKYDAWRKFNTMPQHFAMMKYVEVVEHFNSSGAAFKPSEANAGGEAAVLNMMDDSDIVYDDEDESSIDLSLDDDYDSNMDLGTDMSIGAKQSTLVGIDSVSQDFEGEISMSRAASVGNVEALQLRIDLGNDVNEQDSNGQTALHMAADRGNVDCVEILLKAGADPNAADKEGISVLGAAVIGGNVAVVKILLGAGADPDHEDMDGDTPRSCAEDDDNEELKTLLRMAKKIGEKDESFGSIVSC